MRLFTFTASALVAASILAADGAAEGDLWINDFEKVEIGDEPADSLVLEGEFTVQEFEGGRSLMLPGSPLGTHGILIGPNRDHGVSISARIHGKSRGRRAPALGVGLCGADGPRLQVSPGSDSLEVLYAGRSVARVDHRWVSGWTWLKLELVRSGDDRWTVRGKAWRGGDEQPAEWAIEHELAEAPRRGRASLWGVPYSGEAIRFDDVAYREAP